MPTPTSAHSPPFPLRLPATATPSSAGSARGISWTGWNEQHAPAEALPIAHVASPRVAWAGGGQLVDQA
jgi:hypothetical protein